MASGIPTKVLTHFIHSLQKKDFAVNVIEADPSNFWLAQKDLKSVAERIVKDSESGIVRGLFPRNVPVETHFSLRLNSGSYWLELWPEVPSCHQSEVSDDLTPDDVGLRSSVQLRDSLHNFSIRSIRHVDYHREDSLKVLAV